jgi:esterase/lipase
VTVCSGKTIPQRLDRLDSYLTEKESRTPMIRDGCEKKIVWYDGQRRQRNLAIVYIHGFSASRMETWPLCDHLARAMGANLFYTRLAGHGQDGHAMARATVEDWQNDGMEAVTIGRRLGRKIILVGTSTGGTLAVWLAAQPSISPMIHGLILLSPNFFPKNPIAALTLWPPALRLLERFFGAWRCFTVSNVMQSRYWTVRYPLRAIATMMQLVYLSWRVGLRNAAMPVLMMVNPWDRVINVTVALLRYLSFASPHKKLVLFKGNKDLGRHVLAGDILAPECTAGVTAIILSYLQDRS